MNQNKQTPSTYKLTKHQDDIRRGIRQPERFDPKSRSVDGRGPWRMVKCKDGAYVCFEQHEEIIDNLRSVAEDNKKECEATRSEIAHLKAEVERLIKAGDVLERVLTNKMSSYEVCNASHEWRSAKEGKQP